MAREITTVRIVATNNGRGPRGINIATGGTIIVPRGATSAEIEVADAEFESLKQSGIFAINELGAGATVTRNEQAVRASRIKTQGDNLAKLEQEVSKIEGDVKEWKSRVDQKLAELEAALTDPDAQRSSPSRRGR